MSIDASSPEDTNRPGSKSFRQQQVEAGEALLEANARAIAETGKGLKIVINLTAVSEQKLAMAAGRS